MSAPFLAHLGLQDDADERDIKRAYARLLKQIDQATDAPAFQALREAYEAALLWHRQGRASSPPSPVPVPVPVPAPAPEPTPPPAPKSDPGPQPAPRVERPPEQAPSRSPTPNRNTGSLPSRDPPSADVLAVFRQFMDTLTTHDDKASMRQALILCLDDARVQSLDARHAFEGLIAKALGKGWKPGHDILMAVAVELFAWRKDPRHLTRWGQAGSEIEQSLADQVVFDSQPTALQERLREVIRLLRGVPRTDDAAKAEIHRVDLEILIVQFGSWLRMNAPAERVRQWRHWAKNPPERSALLADVEINIKAPPPPPMPAPTQRPVAAQPAPQHGPTPATGKKAPAIWFILGLAVGMAVLFMVLEGPHLFGWSTTATSANGNDDPLDAVKAAFKPREFPPGYGPPQRRPPYPPPPPFQAQPPVNTPAPP